jgi:hypothetical protein
VGLSLPSIISVSGSPVTSSGTLTGALTTQAVNTIFAGPSSGAGVAPTFRSLTTADIPTLNQNTTGTAANITATSNSTLTTLSALSLPGSQVSGNISGNAANVTGIVAVANGGTGVTTSTGTGNTVLSTSPTLTTPIITALDTQFTLQDNVDPTKQANFELSAITTATTGTYTLPAASATLAGLGTVQTFSANQTFSGNVSMTSSSFTRTATTQAWLDGSMTTAAWTVGGTAQTGIITLGRSTAAQTLNIANGATATATTKTVNIGTAGLSGSTTVINIGSAVAGATTTTSVYGELTATAHVSSNGIQINATTVATSYTIATGNNGLSAGPVSVSTGVTVTVSTGSTWVVV